MAMTDDQRRALGLIGPKPTDSGAPSGAGGTAVPPGADTGAPDVGVLGALGRGALTGGEDILNTPSALLGARPLVDVNTPGAQAAQTQHPWAYSIGRVLGQVPAAVAAAYATPELGALAGLGRLGAIAAPVVRGAIAGGLQNALTAGETVQPSGATTEDLGSRILRGAGWGGALGPVAAKVGSALGLGETLSPEVQQAGKTLQGGGVDVTEANLPRASTPMGTMGASISRTQAPQFNTALSKTFGQDVPDFGPANVQAMENAIGPQINAAAARGQINPTAPGSTFTTDLNHAEAAINDPGNVMQPHERAGLSNQVQQIRNILADPRYGGVIPGSQFDSLTGAGSRLARWSMNNNDFGDVAHQLDDVLRSGFKASSPADAYDDWVTARTNYRLLKAVENSIGPDGNVNPTTLYNTIVRKFPDVRSLPSSAGTSVTQARDLAAAGKIAFGGGTPAAPPSTLGRDLLSYGGVGGLAGYGAHLAFPSLVANPLVGMSAALVPVGQRVGQAAINAWRSSPNFVNNLLARGAQPGGQFVNPLMSNLGAAAAQPSRPAYGQ